MVSSTCGLSFSRSSLWRCQETFLEWNESIGKNGFALFIKYSSSSNIFLSHLFGNAMWRIRTWITTGFRRIVTSKTHSNYGKSRPKSNLFEY